MEFATNGILNIFSKRKGMLRKLTKIMVELKKKSTYLFENLLTLWAFLPLPALELH